MFCEHCGSEVEEGDSFCRTCGRLIREAGSADAPAPCTRVRQGRMVAGVCAGCSEYFGRDVKVVRIVWTVAAVMPPFFPGVAAYLVAWLLMPGPGSVGSGEPPAGEALA